MKIIPLSEGSFTIDKSKHFVPFNNHEDELQERPAGSLLVEVQPFVIITPEDVLLLDTGLGFADSEGVPQLHRNLMDQGINPSEVTKVLLTHLHKDHAGGVSCAGEGPGDHALSFPQANYFVQEQELAYAFEKGFPSYITGELECLRQSSRLRLVNGTGVINGYIKYELSGGHCPFHQVFWIVDGGERIFFGGDEAPQLQQMKSRFVAKYDFDGRKAMELRQQWWKQGQDENWTFLFYHDVKTPVYPVPA